MKRLPALIFNFIVLLLTNCHGQAITDQQNQHSTTPGKVVGGPFENGDFMYIGMPKRINATDTSAGWYQDGQRLLITGTIFKKDGKTPAPGVILYYYHTRGYSDFFLR